MVSSLRTHNRDFSRVVSKAQHATAGKAANVYGLVLNTETGLWDWYRSEDEQPQRPPIGDLHYTFAGQAGQAV